MIRFCSPALTFLMLVTPVVAQSFKGMRSRIPDDANTLILINAEKMFGSPVADRDRWEARRKAAYESGVSALPPDAVQVVLAGRTDHEFGESLWELALIRLNSERNVSTVAVRYGGSVDNISGRSAVRLPNDHYVVQIRDDLLGSYTPANRQDVSRWLKKTDMIGATEFPSYLSQAFVYATKGGTPIIMAMDVEGLMSEAEIKSRLEQFELVKNSDVSTNQLAKLIASVRGITLGITLNKETIGAIRVDFAESPKLLAEIGKPMLLEVLRRQGAMIDDFESWTPSISENTFLLRGKLSSAGTRRVLSVLELPRSLADSMQAASSPSTDQEGSLKRIASQQYYGSVNALIEDLREKPKKDHVKTFGQAAMWYDKYARKIDHLPILHVDEDLLDYGAYIANSFRDAEAAMKGVGMRSVNRTRGNGGGSYGGYRSGGSYAHASIRAEGRNNANIRTQERSRGAGTVQNIWQQIDEAAVQVRRNMTTKFEVEF